jgi:hypothetical protein
MQKLLISRLSGAAVVLPLQHLHGKRSDPVDENLVEARGKIALIQAVPEERLLHTNFS